MGTSRPIAMMSVLKQLTCSKRPSWSLLACASDGSLLRHVPERGPIRSATAWRIRRAHCPTDLLVNKNGGMLALYDLFAALEHCPNAEFKN